MAEIVKHFHPRLVNLHSYVPACSTDQKLSNWSLLNRQGMADPGTLSNAPLRQVSSCGSLTMPQPGFLGTPCWDSPPGSLFSHRLVEAHFTPPPKLPSDKPRPVCLLCYMTPRTTRVGCSQIKREPRKCLRAEQGGEHV